jgi:hypothetical protein
MSLSLRQPLEPELCDAVLFAAGEALYIANAFEEKCKFVLRIANLEAFVVNKAGVSLTEAFASIAKDKMLHSTLVDLGKFPQVTPDDLAALEKAKDGRNFIAHEGALFGMVWLAPKREIEEHVEKLRNAVRALAEGDNVVSGWVYEIEEKERPPVMFVSGYPDMVQSWVFNHFVQS